MVMSSAGPEPRINVLARLISNFQDQSKVGGGDLKAPTAVRQENKVMNPVGLRTKNTMLARTSSNLPDSTVNLELYCWQPLPSKD
jgi:hypothetical protein